MTLPKLDHHRLPFLLGLLLITGACTQAPTPTALPPGIDPEHPHARQLWENAFHYTHPAHGLTDPVSGYPVEGWNQNPEQGLHLRSFTQLTAIGAWIELLADIAAGQAENPYRTPGEALRDLEQVMDHLRRDQHNPELSAKGLLSNFIGFEGVRREGPLTSRVNREAFLEEFGDEQGAEIWQALAHHGWIAPDQGGLEATVVRSATYGLEHFEEGLAIYEEAGLAGPIMDLLDKRVVNVIFGDNVNLTASVAKAIGALSIPELQDDLLAGNLRQQMEAFLENQREGYQHLYDAEEQSFAFGWNVTEDQLTGWELEDGTWVVGRMNYLINEFRGGWMFVVLRYGFPHEAVLSAQAELAIYRLADGSEVLVPKAWDGSAFQILGLSLFMGEREHAAWGSLMTNAVDALIDYSRKHDLPGFLSESYSGNETEYTGKVGIPELAVTREPRITEAPSLYTLGVAYSIDPEATEAFLGEQWPIISSLFTDHGPWEGYQTTDQAPIRFQTAAHTLALLLGLNETADANMERYLASKNLLEERDKLLSGLAGFALRP